MNVCLSIYKRENSTLLENKKETLSNRLKNIHERLQKKSDIDDFLESQIIEVTNPEENYLKIKDTCLLLFIIKILGTIFVSLYLVGIFELICVMDAIKLEFFASFRLYLLRKNEEGRKDFYTNLLNISKKIPSFSPFFLSSFLSKFIIHLLGLYLTSILVLLINGSIIYFALNNFPFHKEDNLEENYTLREFLNLLAMFIGIYISIGIIALVPLETVKKGFQEYDKNESLKFYEMYQHFTARVYGGIEAEEGGFLDDEEKVREAILRKKEQIKKEEETIKDDIVNQNKKDIDLRQNVYKKFRLTYKMNINGYLIFYLISMVFSGSCTIIINNFYLSDYKEENREKINYIIIFSFLSIFLSLFFYLFYSCVFNNKKENKEVSVIKFGGYVIYKESYSSDDGFCTRLCSDIGECFKKLNYACCCQLCSCTFCFKCLFCFKCSCQEYNNREYLQTNDIRKEQICIIYKINGLCSYFTKLFTNPKVLIFVPVLYLFNSFNIGFTSVLSENQNDDKKTLIINILSLISILIFFSVNFIFGKIITKYIFQDEDDKDFYVIIYGLICVVLFESIFSSIISCFIYFNVISDNLKGYFIIISLESIEYIKIISLNYFAFYFQINSLLGELLSNSSILSFYLIIWNLFEIFINLFDITNHLLLFQFIFGIIIFILAIIFLILTKKESIKDTITELVSKIDES